MRIWWATRAEASSGLLRYIDEDERARFRAYRRREDRDRFLVGCALAKIVVGHALGVEPEALRFDRRCPSCGRPHGKPRIVGGPAFSVTHSANLVGVAVSLGGPVGLDVEVLRGAHVIDAALAPVEVAGVRSAADPVRAFVLSWVRKEAAVKAIGAGFRVEPRDVIVSREHEPARLLSWPLSPMPEEIVVRDLAARRGYVAAVATVGPTVHVEERDGAPLVAALGRTAGEV